MLRIMLSIALRIMLCMLPILVLFRVFFLLFFFLHSPIYHICSSPLQTSAISFNRVFNILPKEALRRTQLLYQSVCIEYVCKYNFNYLQSYIYIQIYSITNYTCSYYMIILHIVSFHCGTSSCCPSLCFSLCLCRLFPFQLCPSCPSSSVSCRELPWLSITAGRGEATGRRQIWAAGRRRPLPFVSWVPSHWPQRPKLVGSSRLQTNEECT